MSTTTPSKATTEDWRWLQPFLLAVPFTAIVSGVFNLSNLFPLPVALVIGAGWGVVLGLIVSWINKKAMLSAWLEDSFVVLGVFASAFSACGGLVALLMLDAALDSSSITAETLVMMYLPLIPYYIIANTPMELLIIPALLFLGWRAGKRRILIIAAAALYFALRVWSYLVFVPNRLAFAELERSTGPFTAAERQQAYADLKVDDPRWILVLVIFATLLLAAHFPRFREQRVTTLAAGS